MAKRTVRIKAVRRDEVDVDKLVSGLVLLLEDLAASAASNPEDPKEPRESDP